MRVGTAVGGLGSQSDRRFVSHCVWQSIMESLSCGVPIVTWPIYAGQQLKAFRMVREFGFGSGVEIGLQDWWRCRDCGED